MIRRRTRPLWRATPTARRYSQALKTGEGESTRYSATLLQKTLYYARRLGDGTGLRISLSAARRPGLLILGVLQPMLAGAGRGIDPLGRSRPAALEADRSTRSTGSTSTTAAQRQL